MSSPSTSGNSKKSRRRVKFSMADSSRVDALIDSGSEGESDFQDEEEAYDFCNERSTMRQMRDEAVLFAEVVYGGDVRRSDDKPRTAEVNREGRTKGEAASGQECEGTVMFVEVYEGDLRLSDDGVVVTEYEVRTAEEVSQEGRMEGDMNAEAMLGHEYKGTAEDVSREGKMKRDIKEEATLGHEYEGLNDFKWSEDFSTFSGREETYLRNPGPTVDYQDPVEIFMTVWDDRIMEEIVRETNRYAWQIIAALSETESSVPEFLDCWIETTVSEMYRYFAILILMSMCYRSRMREYWTTSILSMPEFRKVMSRHRFEMITRFLHFVDNDHYDPSLSSYDKKIHKIRPILDHCNSKFASLYIPNKQLSLDESLLLWKGRLSWAQCIRTKAARFGIKSFDLVEAQTGYLLRCLLYAGKESSMSEAPVHGFDSSTAKVVLELMDGFLDVGHTVVMDNWYNQLPLTRFLKRRRTDVIGTMNPRAVHVPAAIKHANDWQMPRGRQIAMHCGDISLVAWKDVKLVTTVSTYHLNRQFPGLRAGKAFMKPEAIFDYNKFMGGVDSKDQKLSMYLMERKRCRKWYMKVFHRLLNTSILNSFIIYTKHPMIRPLTHREYRYRVALGLLKRFPKLETPARPSVDLLDFSDMDKNRRRLRKEAKHYVAHTEKIPGKNSHKQMRCARCAAAKRRTMVTFICTFCQVPLCVGTCWQEYHELVNLKAGLSQSSWSRDPP